MLLEHSDLFDGSLGQYEGDPVSLNLKPNAQPQYTKPFPIPHICEEELKKEVERLIKLGVLCKIDSQDSNFDSAWSSSSFCVPKKLLPGETIPQI